MPDETTPTAKPATDATAADPTAAADTTAAAQPAAPGISEKDEQLIASIHGIDEKAIGEVKKNLPNIIQAEKQGTLGNLITKAIAAIAGQFPDVLKAHVVQVGKLNTDEATTTALKKVLAPYGVPKKDPSVEVAPKIDPSIHQDRGGEAQDNFAQSQVMASTDLSRFGNLIKEGLIKEEEETEAPPAVEEDPTKKAAAGEAPTEGTLDVAAWTTWVSNSLSNMTGRGAIMGKIRGTSTEGLSQQDTLKKEIWEQFDWGDFPAVWTVNDFIGERDAGPNQFKKQEPLIQAKLYVDISGAQPSDKWWAPRLQKAAENPDAKRIIGIINQMIELDVKKQGGTGTVKEELIAYLKTLDSVKELVSRQPAKWWQYDSKNLTSIKAINELSKEMDEKYSIRRTIVAMPATEIVELITQLDAIQKKTGAQAEFDAAEGEVGQHPDATDRIDPVTGMADSYKPIGDILEEAFGIGGDSGSMVGKTIDKKNADGDVEQVDRTENFTNQLIQFVTKNPDSPEVKAVMVLVIGGAVKHPEFEKAIYPNVSKMEWVKELADKWWKSRGKLAGVKKRADKKEAEAEAEYAAAKAAHDKELKKYDPSKGFVNMSYDPQDTKLGKLGTILREELAKRNKSE